MFEIAGGIVLAVVALAVISWLLRNGGAIIGLAVMVCAVVLLVAAIGVQFQ